MTDQEIAKTNCQHGAGYLCEHCWPKSDQEINEAVARKMGAKKLKDCDCGDPYDDHWELTHEWRNRKYAKNVPNYCHSIEAAWEIVGHLTKNGSQIYLQSRNDAIRSGWDVSLDEVPQTHADTAPMAICQAFLKLP